MKCVARGKLLDMEIECIAHRVGTTGKSFLIENIKKKEPSFIAVEAHDFEDALRIAFEILEEETSHIVTYEWKCHYCILPCDLYARIVS